MPHVLKTANNSMIWENAAYRFSNLALDPRTTIYGAGAIEILDGYYGGSAPTLNYGSLINGFEYSTGIQIIPSYLKP